jgi:hypothetical protein
LSQLEGSSQGNELRLLLHVGFREHWALDWLEVNQEHRDSIETFVQEYLTNRSFSSEHELLEAGFSKEAAQSIDKASLYHYRLGLARTSSCSNLMHPYR